MLLEILLISTVTLLFFILILFKKPDNFPPGPPWLPLVGNLLYLKRVVEETKSHHLAWSRLAGEYGPVVGVKLGTTPPMVIVSGRSAVVEAFSNEDFDGRPDGYVFKSRTMGKRRGVLFTDGDLWKDQRRFLLKNLREFGFGKRNMETLIQDEAQICVKKLIDLGTLNKDHGVPMQLAFTIPVLNSLWSMLAGVRFEDDDPILNEFTSLSNQIIRSADSTGGFLNHLPELRFLAPGTFGFTLLQSLQNKTWEFFYKFVKEHSETISQDFSRDLIDMYLKEIDSTKSNNYSELQLVALIKDMFSAGSETSSNTLSFAILHMVLEPEIQAKVHKEIDQVVGWERLPNLDDKPHMHYLNAVLMEVQRTSNVTPTSIPHRAVRETKLAGFDIPENTTILMNLWSLHMDQEHWGDPHVFRPERFLDKHGCLVNDPWFMPFGSGRRRCLGETMAKSTLFLFFAMLLQKLEFTVPNPSELPSSKGLNGFTLMPPPFNALIAERAML